MAQWATALYRPSAVSLALNLLAQGDTAPTVLWRCGPQRYSAKLLSRRCVLGDVAAVPLAAEGRAGDGRVGGGAGGGQVGS